MRFEIRSGGMFLILVGLLGLSGAVFALGLVAGYEVARQNQPDLNQISSVFPVPSPPAAETTPVEPAQVTSPAVAPSSRALASTTRAPLAPAAGASPAAVAKARVPAAIAPTRPPPSDEAADEGPNAAAPPPVLASAPSSVASEAHHKPYNIQIEAVMDKAGADDMVAKLRALGYQPHETQTQIDGQQWYRVLVGPYATQQEAQAAQERLRQQYRAAYTTR